VPTPRPVALLIVLGLVLGLALAPTRAQATLALSPADLLSGCEGGCSSARVFEIPLGTIVLHKEVGSWGGTYFEYSYDFSALSDSIRGAGLAFDFAYAPYTMWTGLADPYENAVFFSSIETSRSGAFVGWLDENLRFSQLVLSSSRMAGLGNARLILVERTAPIPEPGAALVFGVALLVVSVATRRLRGS
jgi:hypothetical protein